MNLRAILDKELNKAREMADGWQAVVSGLETTLAAMDRLGDAPVTVTLEKPPPNVRQWLDVPQDQPEGTSAPAAEVEAGASTAGDELSYAEAAALIGTTAKSLKKNQVYRRQVHVTRSGYVSRASVEAYLQKRATDPKTRNAVERHRRTHEPEPVTTAPGVPDGMVLLSDLAETYDLTIEGVRFKLKQAGVESVRVAGLHGRQSAVDAAAGRKAMEAKTRKEKPEPRPFDEPKPLVKDLPREPWDPTQTVNDKYISMEDAAKELNVNLDWLRAVKKSGRIYGAPDWINWNQLQAYMKHPDFDEPLIERAR